MASVFSGTNQNAVAQQLVSGLINAKVKSQLPKRTSNNVISSRSPEFTFIFDPDTGAITCKTSKVRNQDYLTGGLELQPLQMSLYW